MANSIYTKVKSILEFPDFLLWVFFFFKDVIYISYLLVMLDIWAFFLRKPIGDLRSSGEG